MSAHIIEDAPAQQPLQILAYVPDMWHELKTQITPFNSVITIQGRAFFALNMDSQFWLLDNLSDMLQTEVSYVRDSIVDRIFLGPTIIFPQDDLLEVAGSPPVLVRGQSARNSPSASTATSSPSSISTMATNSPSNTRGSSAKKSKVPRPPNAFILYRQEQHPTVKAQNPGIHNNKISVIIGAKWQSETDDVRNHFKQLAEKLKQEHLLKHPNYQYRPRKPCEKKKRMTKRKAALLAAATAAQDIATLQQVASTTDASGITPDQDYVDIDDIVDATESQLPYFVGNFAYGVQGTLPSEDHIWGELDRHNKDLAEHIPDPASFFETASLGIAEEFGPSLEFQAAQLDDLEKIDWATIIDEVEHSSKNIAGSSSFQLDDFDLTHGLDGLFNPALTGASGTIAPGAYLVNSQSSSA